MVPALPITETEGFGKNALGLHEIPIITPMKLPWNSHEIRWNTYIPIHWMIGNMKSLRYSH